MDDSKITTLDALEATLGKMPSTIAWKVIDRIDAGAHEWINACSLAFLGFSSDDGPLSAIAGGEAGFIQADEATVAIPRSSIDVEIAVSQGAGFGSLLILPHTGEMLRINGRVYNCVGDKITVRVEECYIHCAKALIRSDFWTPEKGLAAFDDPVNAINASRFLVLTTMNDKGDVDVSPKGDPAGALAIAKNDHIWIADRPGNRRADSFKNIICQPKVSGIFLTPGSCHAEYFSGTAEPTTDEIRKKFAVKDRIPSIATRIAVANRHSTDSTALQRSEIWKREKTGVNPAAILAEHVKLNKHQGLKARLVGTIVSLPGVMRKSLDSGYEKHLY